MNSGSHLPGGSAAYAATVMARPQTDAVTRTLNPRMAMALLSLYA